MLAQQIAREEEQCRVLADFLDVAFRHQSWTVETSDGTTWTTTADKTNHYADDSDTPCWISEDTATGR